MRCGISLYRVPLSKRAQGCQWLQFYKLYKDPASGVATGIRLESSELARRSCATVRRSKNVNGWAIKLNEHSLAFAVSDRNGSR